MEPWELPARSQFLGVRLRELGSFSPTGSKGEAGLTSRSSFTPQWTNVELSVGRQPRRWNGCSSQWGAPDPSSSFWTDFSGSRPSPLERIGTHGRNAVHHLELKLKTSSELESPIPLGHIEDRYEYRALADQVDVRRHADLHPS